MMEEAILQRWSDWAEVAQQSNAAAKARWDPVAHPNVKRGHAAPHRERILKAKGPFTAPEMARRLGTDRRNIYAVLNRMVEAGLVRIVGTGPRRAAIYEVV